MATSTLGNCYACGEELQKIKMKNHILKIHGNETDGQECCLLMVEGANCEDYWLMIDVPMDKTLSVVDDFLRKIWLECCGHMSAFRSQKRYEYEEIAKSRKLYSFSKGDKLLHEYDFGTTTESLITVLGYTKRKPQKGNVRLLARNVPPMFNCSQCNASAKFFCPERAYDTGNPFYCKKCAKKYENDDMLLPVTNSPRMGECGYEGELDKFAFDKTYFDNTKQDLSKGEESKKSNANVPKSMQEIYEVIAPIITEFCISYLNDEYSDMALLMLEKLCRKRPSPLLYGKTNTWACGIIYTVGSVNFLFDRSQSPHMRASELAEKFGISQSTAGNKAGEIRKILKTGTLDPEWTLPSRLGDNPYVWMFETDTGFIVDVRHAPRAVQEGLFNAGMIPFIPSDRESNVPNKDEGGSEAIIQKSDSSNRKQEQVVAEGQFTLYDE